jgi:hypothetical protein
MQMVEVQFNNTFFHYYSEHTHVQTQWPRPFSSAIIDGGETIQTREAGYSLLCFCSLALLESWSRQAREVWIQHAGFSFFFFPKFFSILSDHNPLWENVHVCRVWCLSSDIPKILKAGIYIGAYAFRELRGSGLELAGHTHDPDMCPSLFLYPPLTLPFVSHVLWDSNVRLL